MFRKLSFTVILCLILSVSASGKISSDELYNTLVSFEGEWDFVEGAKQQGSCTKGEDADSAIVFKLIGKGTAIQEDLMPGSAYQMVTMYHKEDLSENEVIGTHYCVKKNQPAYRADLEKSTSDKIIFKCDKTRSKLCRGQQPFPGSYVDSIVYEVSEDKLTVHYLGRGQKINSGGYTRCMFER